MRSPIRIVCIGLLLHATTCFAQDIGFTRQRSVTARRLPSKDLAYLLTHVEIMAESPLPHLLPPGKKFGYRIMGLTQQGNCVGGCPPSTIFVAVWNYQDFMDGHIRLFRIDGARFWQFGRVEEFKRNLKGGYFLSFTFDSRPGPWAPQRYRVRVGFEGATIQRL